MSAKTRSRIKIIKIKGVALIVIRKGKILILTEFENHPLVGKTRGMKSIPMESIKRNEPLCSAIERLIEEELSEIPLYVYPYALGCYIVNNVAKVYLFLAYALDDDLPESNGEVGNFRWINPKRALNIYLRPGAKEMIQDYLNYLEYLNYLSKKTNKKIF